MYFLLITSTYVTKNAAEKSALAVMQFYQHTLINDDESLKKMRRRITQELDAVNRRHPRCGDIKSSNFNRDKESFSCSVSSPNHTILYYSIFKVNKRI